MLKRIVPRKVQKKAPARVRKTPREPKCAATATNQPLPARVTGLAKAKFVAMATVHVRKVRRATANVGQKCAAQMLLVQKVCVKVTVLVKAMSVGLQ